MLFSIDARPSTSVSKQDSQFFNVFSLVISILLAIALVLMGAARAIGRNNQAEHVLLDAKYIASVEHNIEPLARVAVAGQDNSALSIVESNPDAVSMVMEVPMDGVSISRISTEPLVEAKFTTAADFMGLESGGAV